MINQFAGGLRDCCTHIMSGNKISIETGLPPIESPCCIKKLLIAYCSLCCFLTLFTACNDRFSIEETITESNPAPTNQIAAVKRAISGIESRSWDLYLSSFEPTTSLELVEPGVPGHFEDLQFSVFSYGDEIEDIVFVLGIYEPSLLTVAQEMLSPSARLFLNVPVRVVKAKATISTDVSVPVIENVPIAPGLRTYVEGWFINQNEISLPFDLTKIENFQEPFESVKGTLVLERDGSIFLLRADGSLEMMLTHGEKPMWSPNSAYIAFTHVLRDQSEEHKTSCHWINLQTKEIEEYTMDAMNCYPVAWLPNGNLLLVNLTNQLKSRDAIIDATSGNLVFSTEGKVFNWSSEGNQVLYSSECHEAQRSTLITRNLNSGASNIVTTSAYCWSQAQWSPTEDSLGFVTVSRQGASGEIEYMLVLYELDSVEGFSAQVYKSSSVINDLKWSRSGNYLAFVSRNFKSNFFSLYIFNITSRDLTRYWTGNIDISELIWAPSEEFLAFNLDNSFKILNMQTGDITTYQASHFFGNGIYELKWSPDSKWLAIISDYFSAPTWDAFYFLNLLDVEKKEVKYLAASPFPINEWFWIGSQNVICALFPRDIDGDGILSSTLDYQQENVELILIDPTGAFRWITKNGVNEKFPSWFNYKLPEE